MGAYPARFLASWALCCGASHAQTVASVSKSPAATVPAKAAAAADAVVLSPFEVSGNPNDSYEATNTNSLTGISTPLNKAPLDARMLTRTMMDELGGSEDQRGMQEGDAAQPGAYNSRGFSIGEPRRDGFLRSSTAGFNGFDVESAEAVNGSNNLLYGSGDPGGIVVINSKRASVNQRSATRSAKFDSECSHVGVGREIGRQIGMEELRAERRERAVDAAVVAGAELEREVAVRREIDGDALGLVDPVLARHDAGQGVLVAQRDRVVEPFGAAEASDVGGRLFVHLDAVVEDETTDAADANKRKLFYYPDKVQNNVFLVYRFRGFAKSQMTVQLNIENVLDRQRVLALPRSTNDTIRYFQYQYSPRKFALTTGVTF